MDPGEEFVTKLVALHAEKTPAQKRMDIVRVSRWRDFA